MDLIRAIVLAIRNHEARPSASEIQGQIGNVDDGIFVYHIELLTQSAMMIGIDTGVRKDRYGKANLSLSWAGQEFADNIIDDRIWVGAKQTLDAAELKSASFEVWSQIALAKIKEMCAAGSGR